MTEAISKSTYRKVILDWRRTLPEEEWAEMCRQICVHLLAMDELTSATCVHVYWPMIGKREVDIRPVIHELFDSGCTVLMPVIQGDRLEQAIYTGSDCLITKPFGVMEPETSQEALSLEPTVVVVPALAVDTVGNRIGYGKGLYDSFLRHKKAVKIVPLFSKQIVNGIPSEPHDVPVDILVTEQGQFSIQ